MLAINVKDLLHHCQVLAWNKVVIKVLNKGPDILS